MGLPLAGRTKGPICHGYSIDIFFASNAGFELIVRAVIAAEVPTAPRNSLRFIFANL